MLSANLVLIRSGTLARRESVGSGYLIAPMLILAAHHTLIDSKSVSQPADNGQNSYWGRIQITVGHPRDGEQKEYLANVVWSRPDLDVAILRTDRYVAPQGACKWGVITESSPRQYYGLGYPLAAKKVHRHVEHLRGVLPPLSSGVDSCYVLDQDVSPVDRTDGKKAWAGASGAAIFCEDLLVAVVTQDDQSHGNRRLRARPIVSFINDAELQEILSAHDARPVVLDVSAVAKFQPAIRGLAVSGIYGRLALRTAISSLFVYIMGVTSQSIAENNSLINWKFWPCLMGAFSLHLLLSKALSRLVSPIPQNWVKRWAVFYVIFFLGFVTPHSKLAYFLHSLNDFFS